jgi:hypothetical protein
MWVFSMADHSCPRKRGFVSTSGPSDGADFEGHFERHRFAPWHFHEILLNVFVSESGNVR